jgi:predicted glycoside hydrolase/deacetylase ChbG (UPF0249 family)
MTRLLVITADDLGIDPRRDDGILLCFARGGITQASLMVRGRSAPAAAAAAARIGLPLGLHLDLTESPPSADPATISSLLDASGQKLGKHGLRRAVAGGCVERAHVERETAAQLRAFEALTGALPTHVDGHQHAHAVPALAAWIAPVLAAHGVRTTRVPEQGRVSVAEPDAARFYRSVADDARASRALFAAHGIGSTDAFVGLDRMGFASEAGALLEDVLAASGESVELMAHPGFVGEGVDEFNESPAREHELRVLTAGPFAEAARRGVLRLTSFAGLLR